MPLVDRSGRFSSACLKTNPLRLTYPQVPEYTSHRFRPFVRAMGLIPCHTPRRSPESNGLAEAFFGSLKRDYVYQACLETFAVVSRQVPAVDRALQSAGPAQRLGNAVARRVLCGGNLTEIRSGIRHVLASPRVYDFFQNVAGFYAWRRKVVESFVAAAIPDGGLIIDIGCGTAEVLNYLPPNVEYIGFDRSQGYLNKARARYAHRNARFHCEELSPHFTLRGRRADAILAFGLIHHLDDAMSSDLFRVAKKMLGVNGFLLTLDPVYVDGQSAVARYIISKDRGTAVRTERAYKELACREFSSVETYIDSSPVYIP